MLALTRKKDEAIVISGGIEIKVLSIQGDKVRLGIIAPKEINVYREEVYKSIKENNQEATQVTGIRLEELQKILKSN